MVVNDFITSRNGKKIPMQGAFAVRSWRRADRRRDRARGAQGARRGRRQARAADRNEAGLSGCRQPYLTEVGHERETDHRDYRRDRRPRLRASPSAGSRPAIPSSSVRVRPKRREALRARVGRRYHAATTMSARRRPPRSSCSPFPSPATRRRLLEIKDAVQGKIVVDAAVPLVPPKVSVGAAAAEGSAAQIAQNAARRGRAGGLGLSQCRRQQAARRRPGRLRRAGVRQRQGGARHRDRAGRRSRQSRHRWRRAGEFGRRRSADLGADRDQPALQGSGRRHPHHRLADVRFMQ